MCLVNKNLCWLNAMNLNIRYIFFILTETFQVEKDFESFSNYQLSIINYQLSIINKPLREYGHRAARLRTGGFLFFAHFENPNAFLNAAQ